MNFLIDKLAHSACSGTTSIIICSATMVVIFAWFG